MAESSSAASLSVPLLAKQRRPFLWRKLFSLTGVVPVAGYVCFHLWENAKALQGREAYVEMVGDISKMPFLTFLEVFVIAVPILVHATIGVRILLDGRYNLGAYPYSRNWMYTLQRVTAVIALAFLLYHVWELRLQKALVGLDAGGFYDTLCRNLSSTMGGVPVLALVYVVGIAAVSFHLANGLWGFCFSWGITVSRRSQRLSATLFGLFGLVVFVLGANTSLYFATGSRFNIPTEIGAPPASKLLEHCPTPALASPETSAAPAASSAATPSGPLAPLPEPSAAPSAP
jgi:succinate dehydrogenase / fumarate reductase cytochrome b subunit